MRKLQSPRWMKRVGDVSVNKVRGARWMCVRIVWWCVVVLVVSGVVSGGFKFQVLAPRARYV